jgi:hypothetical protein
MKSPHCTILVRLGFASGLVSIVSGAWACDPPSPAAIESTTVVELAPREIDLAICLDTSGSMQGLIDAARIKLWEIVNDLALAKPSPHLRVALLTYGNDGHVAENGWVNIDAGFTEDLDLISQKLFALTTNGGTELVGRAVDAATKQLAWSGSSEALKIIVVAGNESADQDQLMPYREVCKHAIAGGVMVNAIYCGPESDGIAPAWREVALLADGHFASIDHNNGTIVVSTPFDDELATLSASLNETYVAFGTAGEWAALNQTQQDVNAAALSTAVAAQRCVTKSGAMYRNGVWDLVDACKDASFKLEDVKEEDLPESMRAMTVEQRREYVMQQEQKRDEIQARVSDLNVKRQQFVEGEMRKQAENGDKSFDAAIRKAIRNQAAAKGFVFQAPVPPAAAAQPDSATSQMPDDGC